MTTNQSLKAKARWADPTQRALQGVRIKLNRVYPPTLRPIVLRAWQLNQVLNDWKAVAKQLNAEGLVTGAPWTALDLMTTLQEAGLLDYLAPRPPVPWDKLEKALAAIPEEHRHTVLRELAA